MGGVIRRAAEAASAAVVALGLTAGVASAAGAPVLSWSPTTSPGTYNFGTVTAGQKVSQALTLTNSGGKASGALTVTLAGSPALTTTADTCTGANLSSKKSCRVTVQYAPATPGQTDSATLTATGKTGTASLALAGAAAKASPALATNPGPGGMVGATTVKDTATLSNGVNPTGTIQFKAYGPSATANCTTPPVHTEAVTVTGNGGYPTPTGFTPAQAGTHWWTASYGGDVNSNPATTNCGDESVIITPPSHLYWATPFGQGGGTVNEAGLDGSNPQAIAGSHNSPFGVAVDINHLYWADMSAGTINEANLDGTSPHAIVTGQSQPAAIAVDGSHIYWTNFSASTINEANLDGTGVTTLVPGQSNAMGLAVDNSHLYWTCGCGNGSIKAANLGGTGATPLLSGVNSPFGVAVDSNHLYWTSTSGTINEADLNGSNSHAILTGQGTATGVAVDSGHIYWANGIPNTGTINKANLDDTGVTTLATGQQEPRGVTVGPQ